MKFISLLLIFLFGLNSYSQEFSGRVTYSKSMEISSQKEKSFWAAKRERQIARALESQKFILEFNSRESIFKMQDFVSNDFESTPGIAVDNDIYFKDLDSDITLFQTSFLDKNYRIEIPSSKYEWQLTGESKNIGEYTAYRAITSETLKAPSENLEDKVLHVEAWFTPEIPIPFGPLEINGLPGLVLEFTKGRFTFTAKKISLKKSSDQPLEIDMPTEGELISEAEFSKIGKEMMENLRNGS